VQIVGPIDNGGKGHGSAGTEITSGGPGSDPGCCCGITLGVHNDSGYVYAATEDWTGPSGKHVYICDDDPNNHDNKGGPCTQTKQQIPGYNPKSGQPWNLNLTWEVKTDGQQQAAYTGSVNGVSWSVVDPRRDGTFGPNGNNSSPVILPGQYLSKCSAKKGGVAGDPTRIRADGSNKTTFGPHDGLGVYSLS